MMVHHISALVVRQPILTHSLDCHTDETMSVSQGWSLLLSQVDKINQISQSPVLISFQPAGNHLTDKGGTSATELRDGERGCHASPRPISWHLT